MVIRLADNVGVRDFDGCDPATGTLLEAKGPGIAGLIPWFKGNQNIRDQAINQARIAAFHGRQLEWHFAEKKAADYYRNEFQSLSPFTRRITVHYTPALR